MKVAKRLSKEEINKIYKDSLENHSSLLSYYFYRRISFFICRILFYTPVTPNQISIFGFVMGLTGAIFIASGSRLQIVGAAFLVQLKMVFDVVDGDLARLKSMQSKFGEWLDGAVDVLGMVALYFVLGLGYYRQSGKLEAWILLFLLIASRFLLFSMVISIERVFNRQVYEIVSSPAVYKLGQKLKIQPILLTFEDSVKYLIITLGLLFNQLKFTMLIFIFIHFFLWIFAIVKTVKFEYSLFTANKKKD